MPARRRNVLAVSALGAAILGVASARSDAGGAEAQPPSGGIVQVVFAPPEQLDTMDPAIANTQASWSLLDLTCARLMTYPDKPGRQAYRLVPDVAAAPPKVSRDGKTYTFTLKRGFRFSDGKPVDARAFARGINRTLAPEGSPLTPTYYAMSLLFHVTAPGWQVIGVDPWESNDWSVPEYGGTGLSTSDDQPEKELVGYAGPNGELTVVGLDTRGRDLNTVSSDGPSDYSIGGLPPNTAFNLAVWNATGDGTNSIAGKVTTNSAGVARFTVPLQAAFALTTVPVS